MTKVLIDGVVYVPRAEIPPRTDESTLEAVRAITASMHLYGHRGGGRGPWGCLWDALRALSPDLAKIAEESSPAAAYDAVHPDDDD